MTQLILTAGVTVFLYMIAVFGLALWRKDNSVIDVAWGLGFILVALVSFFHDRGIEARHILVTLLVLVWGVRLALHIYSRNRGRGEDYRYARWRKDWGRWFLPRSFLQIFMLQGAFLLVISYPVLLVNSSTAGALFPLDVVGTGVWLIGFFFEAWGDYQLRKFKQKAENKGKIMTAGLWKYTRHPNYFGEAAMWWGLFVIALAVPGGWTAVISPVLITFLLLKVSGVAMLEKKYANNSEFSAYARRTSAFFPWIPKQP
jgi:steroid 5-alpha reductase family enzyme